MPVWTPGTVTPAVSDRGIKMITVSPALILGWWKGMREPRTFSCKGLPEDAELVGASFEPEIQMFRLYVSSATYPKRGDGCQLEEISVSFAEHYETVAQHR